jgi:hypothetical protein
LKHRPPSADEALPALLPQSSTTGSIDIATLELLAGWRLEDATDDPEEVRAAERELAEFKNAMNANRSAEGMSLLSTGYCYD